MLRAEEISEKIESDALDRAISNFVAEECDDVLPRYRSLVGEAALSCVSHRAKRAEFLKSFGYDVPTPPASPLYPWVVVFLLHFLLVLIPPLVMLYLGGQIPTRESRPSRCSPSFTRSRKRSRLPGPFIQRLFRTSRGHHLFLVVAIRRRLRFCVVRDGCQHSLYVSACLSDSFPIVLLTLSVRSASSSMTVGLSFLIDRRLQSGSLDFERGRIGDGLILAALMVSSTLTFQGVIFDLAPALGWLDVHRPPFVPIRLLFLVLSAGLGFVMGYFVPSATAAFMQRAHLLRLPEPGGTRANLRPGSTARWSSPATSTPG